MRRSPAGLALAAVAALVLAGCTDGGSPTSSSDAEQGPLAAFFEKTGGSYEEQDFEEQQRKIEEIVATCMAEQGFEYTPQDPSAFSMDDDDMPDWSSREFAEQYGYGATTMNEVNGGEEWVDPNADYIASMSESEQAAFNEALYGVMPEITEESEAEATEWNWEENGCHGRATHAVYEQGQIWSDPEVKPILDEMNKEYESLQDDPELRKATNAWADCVAEAGYDFATPDEAMQSIYDEMNALWEAVAPADPETAEPADFEPDPAAMEELKKKELAIAMADFECKEKAKYTEAQEAAYLALDERMWEKYGDQLEAAAAKRTPAK